MNKKIFAIAIITIMFGMLAVSAATLEEEDFGNFTLEVPANEVASDPKKTHTMWEDESIDLCIEYVIFSEDNYTDYEDAMDKLFNGSSKIKEEMDCIYTSCLQKMTMTMQFARSPKDSCLHQEMRWLL